MFDKPKRLGSTMGPLPRQALLLTLSISIALLCPKKCRAEDIVVKCEDAANLDKLVQAFWGAKNRVKLDRCSIVGAVGSGPRAVFVSCDLRRATQQTQEDINGTLKPVDLQRTKEDGKDILTLTLLHGEYPEALKVPVDIELILGFDDRDIARGGNLQCVAETANGMARFVRDAERKKNEIAGKLGAGDKAAVRALASEFYHDVTMNWDTVLKLEGFHAGDTKTTIEQYIQQVESYLETMKISKEDLDHPVASDPQTTEKDTSTAATTTEEEVEERAPSETLTTQNPPRGTPDEPRTNILDTADSDTRSRKIILVARVNFVPKRAGFGDHFRMMSDRNSYLNIAQLDMDFVLEHAFDDHEPSIDYQFRGRVYRIAPSALTPTTIFSHLSGKEIASIYYQPWRYCSTPYSPHHRHDQHNRTDTIDQFDDVLYRNGIFEITVRTNGGDGDKRSVTQHLYIPGQVRTEPYVLLNIEGIKASEMKSCKKPKLEPKSETYPSVGKKVAFLDGNVPRFQIHFDIPWGSVEALRGLPNKTGYYFIKCSRDRNPGPDQPATNIADSLRDIEDPSAQQESRVQHLTPPPPPTPPEEGLTQFTPYDWVAVGGAGAAPWQDVLEKKPLYLDAIRVPLPSSAALEESGPGIFSVVLSNRATGESVLRITIETSEAVDEHEKPGYQTTDRSPEIRREGTVLLLARSALERSMSDGRTIEVNLRHVNKRDEYSWIRVLTWSLGVAIAAILLFAAAAIVPRIRQVGRSIQIDEAGFGEFSFSSAETESATRRDADASEAHPQKDGNDV